MRHIGEVRRPQHCRDRLVVDVVGIFREPTSANTLIRSPPWRACIPLRALNRVVLVGGRKEQAAHVTLASPYQRKATVSINVICRCRSGKNPIEQVVGVDRAHNLAQVIRRRKAMARFRARRHGALSERRQGIETLATALGRPNAGGISLARRHQAMRKQRKSARPRRSARHARGRGIKKSGSRSDIVRILTTLDARWSASISCENS